MPTILSIERDVNVDENKFLWIGKQRQRSTKPTCFSARVNKKISICQRMFSIENLKVHTPDHWWLVYNPNDGIIDMQTWHKTVLDLLDIQIHSLRWWRRKRTRKKPWWHQEFQITFSFALSCFLNAKIRGNKMKENHFLLLVNIRDVHTFVDNFSWDIKKS